MPIERECTGLGSARSKWLAALKVGDRVLVHWSEFNRREIQKIARMTETLFITDKCLRFRRRDGYKPGEHTCYFRWIEQPRAGLARKAGR